MAGGRVRSVGGDGVRRSMTEWRWRRRKRSSRPREPSGTPSTEHGTFPFRKSARSSPLPPAFSARKGTRPVRWFSTLYSTAAAVSSERD